MLMWYLKQFTDRRGSEEIQNELVAKKKAFEEAKAKLEEHSKCESAQAGLLKKFEGACIEVATLTQQLKDLKVKYDQEASETRTCMMER